VPVHDFSLRARGWPLSKAVVVALLLLKRDEAARSAGRFSPLPGIENRSGFEAAKSIVVFIQTAQPLVAQQARRQPDHPNETTSHDRPLAPEICEPAGDAAPGCWRRQASDAAPPAALAFFPQL
jgi:hypothetical protein